MKKLILLVVPFFVLFLFLPAQAQVVDGDIAVDTTWTKSQSPIVVEQEVYVNPGVTLTIEPGVIVKLGDNALFLSSGVVSAVGTEFEPIIFTSLKDDEYGGDTNGDGSSTFPQTADWWQIKPASGSITIMSYVRVFYAGGEYEEPAIDQYRGDFSGDHLLITKNSSGLRNMEGRMTIANSSIFENLTDDGSGGFMDIGIISNGLNAVTVEAVNNWWGSSDGPCLWSGSFEPTCGEIPMVTDYVNFDPWLASDPNDIDPVVLIPGILGSWNISGQWKIDPILHTYDNLWSALENAGYIEEETLFALPYNWRSSNEETSDLLKNKIAEIKSVCNCDQVDIIGHSMGGLIARSYIEGDDYQNDVDQLIFLGTPHLGAAKSYLTWEGGEAGYSLKDRIMGRIFDLESKANGFESVFSYVRGLPVSSVEELLPTYDYLFRPDGELVSDAPINHFLENLNQTANLEKLNSVRIFNLVADNYADDTVEKLRVVDQSFPDGRWEHGYPENFDSLFGDHGLISGPGDGTVPALSNGHIGSSTDFSLASDHRNIVTDAQNLILKLLTGREPVNEIRENLFEKILLIRIFSPADFHVISPDGKFLGKNFVSGEPINEIDNAFYSGFDDEVEFAVIPNPLEGEYEIRLKGTGTGEYKLSASYLDEETSTESVFAGDIFLNQNQDFNLDFSGGGQPLGELEPEDIAIAQVIERLHQMRGMGWIKITLTKTALLSKLNILSEKLIYQDNRIARINSVMEGILNYGFSPAAKEWIMNFLEQLLSGAVDTRINQINYYLNSFLYVLETAKDYNWINNEGYDELNITIEKLREDLTN